MREDLDVRLKVEGRKEGRKVQPDLEAVEVGHEVLRGDEGRLAPQRAFEAAVAGHHRLQHVVADRQHPDLRGAKERLRKENVIPTD